MFLIHTSKVQGRSMGPTIEGAMLTSGVMVRYQYYNSAAQVRFPEYASLKFTMTSKMRTQMTTETTK